MLKWGLHPINLKLFVLHPSWIPFQFLELFKSGLSLCWWFS